MNESARLAEQITRALKGEAWHGPSWKDVLDGIGAPAASHRPIAGAHTIAEVMLHATSWNDIVRRRLSGETPQVTEAEDWPPATALESQAAWNAAVERFFESGRALVETVAAFPPEKLMEQRPGVDGNWFELIIGQLQHLLYHAGQVGLLRKAEVHAGAA